MEQDSITLSGDVLTFEYSGDYIGAISLTLSGVALKKFEIRIYNVTQTSQEGYYQGITTTGAGNYQNITLPIYISATAGDEIRFEVRCISVASGDPTFEHGVFHIQHLHP